MFVNTYNNSLDAKNRCIVPAKFRDELGSTCMVVKYFSDCLYIYTKEEWAKYTKEHIDSRPEEDLEVLQLRDDWYEDSHLCDVDKQGRINIPKEFLDHAHITKEIVNVGQNDRIKVWAKEVFDAKREKKAAEKMERFAYMNKYNTPKE